MSLQTPTDGYNNRRKHPPPQVQARERVQTPTDPPDRLRWLQRSAGPPPDAEPNGPRQMPKDALVSAIRDVAPIPSPGL